jgi:hypothetical protein
MDLEASLANEWHPTLNLPTTIESLTTVSKKNWWQGSCGHDYECSISERRRGTGCGYCAGKKVLIGFNDLASQSPAVAAEWHPTKNGSLLPTQVLYKSSKKYWWLCDTCGHDWEAKALHRSNGSGCPACKKHGLIIGRTDLATTHPLLAQQLHPTKNNGLEPTSITSGYGLVWWFDESCGHEWEAKVKDRVHSGTGCHYCASFKVLQGVTDLASVNPKVAAQWHPTENGSLLPTQFTAHSSKKAVWLCDECEYVWRTAISTRTSGRGCPRCVGSVLVEGRDDLASQNPQLAAQWHPTKNGELTPQQVFKKSGQEVWWLNESCGHEWKAQISNRANGAGCYVCGLAKQGITWSTPKQGVDDLATLYPVFAQQWSSKNSKKPNEVKVGSRYRAIWNCGKHEWSAAVSDRTHYNTGCPECAAKTFVSKPEVELYEFLTQLGLTVEQTNRKVLGKGKELDLYLPEKKFGVEFNGLYWHDENHKPRNYHHDKFIAAQNAGIQLLQVWEDDWRDRKPAILRALAHKLGVTEKLAELYPELGAVTSKVFARKTQVVALSTEQARGFLHTHHVQGFASGGYYLGLQDENEQVRAVLVLRKERNDVLNIVRYATSGTVVGGFTKLLKYAERTYRPDSFITFADHTISNGGLYENNGFQVDAYLPPDYMYVVKGERKHKFGYRLKRFRNDSELLWNESLTEKELAQLNNLPRIWDAGKTRYKLNTK